jgi:hypothetical protein
MSLRPLSGMPCGIAGRELARGARASFAGGAASAAGRRFAINFACEKSLEVQSPSLLSCSQAEGECLSLCSSGSSCCMQGCVASRH